MVEPWDSSYDNCSSCTVSRDRIKELEEINDLHRRVNGELREAVTELYNCVSQLETSLTRCIEYHVG